MSAPTPDGKIWRCAEGLSRWDCVASGRGDGCGWINADTPPASPPESGERAKAVQS